MSPSIVSARVVTTEIPRRPSGSGPSVNGYRMLTSSPSTSWYSTSMSEIAVFSPGDQLMIEVSKLRSRGNFWKFRGEARVGETLVAEANFSAMIRDD